MANADSSTTENPYFTRINRSPYELGSLLQQLPADFSSYKPANEDEIQIAKAASQHAENSLYTVLNGLEGIGEALFVAFANEENTIEPHNLRGIGCLIQHLAIEAQFLRETKDELEYIVECQAAIKKKPAKAEVAK